MRAAPSIEVARTAPPPRAGIVDVLLALWLWATLFTAYGPKEVQQQFHYVPQILLAILAVPLVIRRLAEGRMLLPTEAFLYIAWAVWGSTGLFVARYERIFWSSYGQTWKLLILFLLVAWAVDSYHRLWTLLVVGFLGGMLAATVAPLLGFGSYEEMAGGFGGRARGALGNPNTLSLLASIGFMGTVLAIVTARRKRAKVLWTLGLAAPLYIAWITGSRNAWAALVLFGMMFYLFYLRPRMRGRFGARMAAATTLAVAVVGGTALMLTFSRFAGRFESLIEFLTTGETRSFFQSGRAQTMFAELRMAAKNPIFGVGLGQDSLLLMQYGAPRQLFLHSDMPGLAGLIGLPGWLLYYAILGTLTFRCWRASKHPTATHEERNTLSLVAGFTATSVAMTLFSPLYCAKIAWMFWGGIAGYVTTMSAQFAQRAAQPHPALTPEPGAADGEAVRPGTPPVTTGPLAGT